MTMDNGMTKAENYDELEAKIRDWADDKEIPFKSNYLHQFEKFQEEAAELAEEIAKFNAGENEMFDVLLEMADCHITLINTLYLMNEHLSSADVLRLGYNKISKRSGKMHQGKFVKDGSTG